MRVPAAAALLAAAATVRVPSGAPHLAGHATRPAGRQG